MKILIDVDRALAEGKITADECQRIRALAVGQTSDLALNILIGFGVVALAAGFLTLVPSIGAVVATGAAVAALGIALILLKPERWRMLGEILLVVGATLFAGGLVALDEGSTRSAVGAALLFAAASVLARNGLLAGLAVLALSAAVGARTGYTHAMYMLGVEQPVVTVMAFAALGVALVALAKYLPEHLARLAIIAARVSALLVNLGFWIGSLWGDSRGATAVPRDVFVVGWAVALLCAGVWAWRENRRWPLITATVFAAIHFYTQWFARLGAHPGAILAAGAITIAIGFALKSLLATMPPRTA